MQMFRFQKKTIPVLVSLCGRLARLSLQLLSLIPGTVKIWFLTGAITKPVQFRIQIASLGRVLSVQVDF